MSAVLETERPTPVGQRRMLQHAGVRGWTVAVLVYVTAVFHRSSLGVAGLDAADRFGINASQLSVFVLLQLGVYAAMQVPTGILVDRYGPRRLLIAAALTMTLAQFAFAVAPSYPSALAARTLLGCGDALTFISVLRFASQHFSARRFPVVVSVTGMLGSVGNVVATVPLAIALDRWGWTPSFTVAAATSLVVAVAVWHLLPDTAPMLVGSRLPQRRAGVREPLRAVARRVDAAWRTAGTRAGFWVHCATMSFTTMFGVLWGVPYLVAQGFSRGGASAALMISVAAGVVANPIVGGVFGRHQAARVPFALGVAFATVGLWVALLAGFGGTPPHWLLIVAVSLTAVGGPASSIGFSLARDYNPPALVGTASGVVNVGGFSAAILAAIGVGRVLDLVGAKDAAAFRWAFGVAVVVQLLGSVQAVRWYRRLRVRVLDAQARGEEVPVPAVRRRWDLVAW